MRCCDLHSGMLNTVVEFQRKTNVADGSGGYGKTWAAISGAPTRAHVKALSGSERWASDRVEATTRYRVTVRYFSGLLNTDRIEFNSLAHNITFIDNLEFRDEWLVIDVSGGVAT